VKRHLVAAFLLAALAGAVPAAPLGAHAPSLRVHNEAQFASAVSRLRKSGGTIWLLPHAYRQQLVVPPRTGGWLRILGTPGARVERLLLDHTQRVSIGRLRVIPFAQDARIEADSSAQIDLHDLVVSAAGTPYSASVHLPLSRNVTIRRSEFTHCSDRSPLMMSCVFLRWVSYLTIEDSSFHDCHGCDFVNGRFGRGLTLRGNRFERALPCHGLGRFRCGHQDLVQLFAGRGLVVEGNHFGLYRKGAAQLYLTNAVDNARIENNIFTGTDPRFPGYHARVALIVGAWGTPRVPRDVRILNNTILTGAPRIDGYLGSIRMSSAYADVLRRRRPVLANNVIALLGVPGHVCKQLRASVSNLILKGRRCSDSDLHGDAGLDPRGRPTADSTLLIDGANGRYATSRDITGRPRGRTPDIGAYEHAGPR
jgi:hypothetical protein